MSARLKLTLSYAAFLMVAGGLLLAAVWVFLLRYVPEVINLPDVMRPGTGPDGMPGPGMHVPTRSDLERAFAPRAAQALGFLLVFGLLGGWLLAGRMLAPLTRITDATRRAADGALSHRIALEGRNDEFRELADGFDEMLARIEAQVAEQQRFAANASHELRTPLSVTQALLEVAKDDPDRDPDQLIARLRTVNARAIHLTEALLLLSRTDAGTFTEEDVELTLVVEEATETLLPFAENRGVVVEVSGENTAAVGSQALLLLLTTNLLHNAIVHNQPGRGFVWVTTGWDRSSATLTVENTGQTLSPQLVSTLVEPFQRGSARIHTDHDGVGLGLAIVNSITRAHHGILTLTPRPGGGLCVTVRLPAAPPPTWSAERPSRRG